MATEAHTSIASCAALAARVTKRLSPGQNGTKRYQTEFGESLVCVRYRQDGNRRYTTVELLVDHSDLPPRGPSLKDFVAVHIDYREKELRQLVKEEGAMWDPDSRVWIMPRSLAKRLGVEDRIK